MAVNCDLTYACRLLALLNPNFPERVAVILVLNNSWVIQSLWNNVLSPLIDPETKEEIVVFGSGTEEYHEEAAKWVGDDHQYLIRCRERRKGGKKYCVLSLPR